MLVDARLLFAEGCVRAFNSIRCAPWTTADSLTAPSPRKCEKKTAAPARSESVLSLLWWLCGTTGVADIRKHKTATLCARLFGREMRTLRRHFRSF